MEALKPLERQVLELMADGKNIEDTAQILRLSFGTVKNYRSNLQQKLEAQTGPHAVAIAFRTGLLT
jgi:LuxR family transcriptional activator of conjugal transfer of Ti plasmids